MKTSALIAQLKREIEEHGDLDCCIEMTVTEGASARQHMPVEQVRHEDERPALQYGELSGRKVLALKCYA